MSVTVTNKCTALGEFICYRCPDRYCATVLLTVKLKAVLIGLYLDQVYISVIDWGCQHGYLKSSYHSFFCILNLAK